MHVAYRGVPPRQVDTSTGSQVGGFAGDLTERFVPHDEHAEEVLGFLRR